MKKIISVNDKGTCLSVILIEKHVPCTLVNYVEATSILTIGVLETNYILSVQITCIHFHKHLFISYVMYPFFMQQVLSLLCPTSSQTYIFENIFGGV